MLSESVANEKDSAAGACGKGRLPACVRDRGKTAIELAELGARGCSESLGKGYECQVELGAQAELRCNAAKVQDRGADRQRRHQVRALQRPGRVGHSREPTIHATLPILGMWVTIGGEAPQVTQGKCQKALGPHGWRRRRQQTE